MIAAEQISVQLSRRVVLDAISLNFAAGSLHAVCGMNGSGKTTLLRALAGLQELSAGRVKVEGQPLNKMSLARRSELIAWVAAEPEIGFSYTSRDVLRWSEAPVSKSQHSDVNRPREMVDALRLMPLLERSLLSLSLGEKKRVWLASAYQTRCPVLIFDEPCSALDPAQAMDFLDCARQLCRSKQLTVIASFHDLALVHQFADTVTLMRDGNVTAHGSTAEIFAGQALTASMEIGVRSVPLSKDSVATFFYRTKVAEH